MQINNTSMTVANYCAAMERGEIIVNRDYQRSNKVWPDAARGYLIESIILGYPIPKLSLYPETNLRTRKTISEIVDGQQRTMAVLDFFNGDFRLPQTLETEEIAGRSYPELDNEHKRKFVTYSLNFDEFVATTREEIVEVFRRMNSYTIPLSPEEHRHAFYQGKFKWFINAISTKFSKPLTDMSVFKEKQLVRMLDTKLFAEICDALLNGIRTTTKGILNKLYKSRDKRFPEERDLRLSITKALDTIREWEPIHDTNLMKPYVFYSLMLAVIHQRERSAQLQVAHESARVRNFDDETAIQNLLALNEAIESPEDAADFKEFSEACNEKTNTRDNRTIRFRWLCRALVDVEFP